MEQENTSPVVQNTTTLPKKHTKYALLGIYGLVFLFIVLAIGYLSYQLGFVNGKHAAGLNSYATNSNINTKTTVKKANKDKDNDEDDNNDDKTASIPSQKKLYTLIYTSPTGFNTMIWYPTPKVSQIALLSPDYTSIADPEPETGISILIYQLPGSFASLDKLRPAIDDTEEGLSSLTQTKVAGFPAYNAVYNDSDSDRMLDDYDILKGTDRWLVRLVFPGDSQADMTQEESKYTVQINDLLQSIQFKTIQYQ